MGDNGFHLGEHGFYDKRDAFETSIRVPMLAWAPGLIAPGSHSEKMVQNIDVAPTALALLESSAPPGETKFDGRSFEPILRGREPSDWRDHILYEYHWEWNFPATPTTFAIRTDRYKYVYYHGTWDIDSFHDLQTDPVERAQPDHRAGVPGAHRRDAQAAVRRAGQERRHVDATAAAGRGAAGPAQAAPLARISAQMFDTRP